MKPTVTLSMLALVLLSCSSCGARDAAHSVPSPAAASASSPAVVLPGGSKVVVEVVSDQHTRAQGLMFRSSLGEGRGMLFVFPETAVHPFWMKNTLIPLDIIWIDEGGAIVHIASDVPPCRADPCPSYPPKGAARYVLELAGGQAAAQGLRDGDRLAFEGIENIVAR